jgi:hypothetical protein
MILPWDCELEDLPVASDESDGPYIVISEP